MQVTDASENLDDNALTTFVRNSLGVFAFRFEFVHPQCQCFHICLSIKCKHMRIHLDPYAHQLHI